MNIFDISVNISGSLPEWPGSTKFLREEVKTSAITSKVQIGTHFGTHVDAPKHFLFGSDSIEKVALQKLVGKFKVFEIKSKISVSLDDIKNLKINFDDRILFKTKNSAFVESKNFRFDYVHLSLEAAEYLAKKKISLVGIDYFGIEAKGSPGHKVHMALLKNKIAIVEGLNLSKVKPGTYNGAILPLKIKGADGAPARAVLWE